MKRIAITGCSGYLGVKLAAAFQENGSQVLGIDLRPPGERQLNAFAALDICDLALAGVMQEFAPDTVIHAAFVVTPGHDTREMRRVNVEGTRNLLAAAAAVRPERVLLISSATAYGAWLDNPIPMEEDWPLRARTAFPYAADKTEVERIVARFAEQNPGLAVSWVRPTIVGGPEMNNYLRRIIFGMPFLVKMDGYDPLIQLVHEQDLVNAIQAILRADGRGAYNVAPPDWIHLSDIGRETGRWLIWVPFWFCWLVYGCGWLLRLPYPETPPGFLHFARYPWVVRAKRLEEELGFRFQYSTEETMQAILGSERRTDAVTAAR